VDCSSCESVTAAPGSGKLAEMGIEPPQAKVNEAVSCATDSRNSLNRALSAILDCGAIGIFNSPAQYLVPIEFSDPLSCSLSVSLPRSPSSMMAFCCLLQASWRIYRGSGRKMMNG
jgi:hypothetical protein